MEQNNLDLVKLMIDNHHAKLRAAYQPCTRHIEQRAPSRIRVALGHMLIEIGERVRGAQSVPAEHQPARLAMGK
jgi:hypothetical protein